MVTFEQAMTADHFVNTNDGTKWRRNGKTQTWKRDYPGRFRLPIKYGLYGYSAITPVNAHLFTVVDD